MVKRSKPRATRGKIRKTKDWEVLVAGSDKDAEQKLIAALGRMGLTEDAPVEFLPDVPRRLETTFEINKEGISKTELERLRQWMTSREAHEPIIRRILRQQEPADPNWPKYVWGQWKDYSGGESFGQGHEIVPRRPLHAIGASSIRDLMREIEGLPTHPVGNGECQLIKQRVGSRWVPRCAGNCEKGTCRTKLYASKNIFGVSCYCG